MEAEPDQEEVRNRTEEAARVAVVRLRLRRRRRSGRVATFIRNGGIRSLRLIDLLRRRAAPQRERADNYRDCRNRVPVPSLHRLSRYRPRPPCSMEAGR